MINPEKLKAVFQVIKWDLVDLKRHASYSIEEDLYPTFSFTNGHHTWIIRCFNDAGSLDYIEEIIHKSNKETESIGYRDLRQLIYLDEEFAKLIDFQDKEFLNAFLYAEELPDWHRATLIAKRKEQERNN